VRLADSSGRVSSSGPGHFNRLKQRRDLATTRWVVTGSLQQDFLGIPASGQTIRVESMNFYCLKDGRVTDVWTQFDGVAMMRQLGAIRT